MQQDHKNGTTLPTTDVLNGEMDCIYERNRYNNSMDWRHGIVVMTGIPLVSVVLFMTMPTFMNLDVNTGTDLERTMTPAALFLVIYVVAVTAPGLAAIAIILLKRYTSVGTRSEHSVMTNPSKVTVVILAIWSAFVIWATVLVPTMIW